MVLQVAINLGRIENGKETEKDIYHEKQHWKGTTLKRQTILKRLHEN